MGVLYQIGIRWQLVVAQLIGFLIAFAVLRHFLFGRVQKVLDDRAADEAKRKAGIASARKAAAEATAKLDARRAEIDKQVYEQSQVEVRAGQKRKSELVAEAIDKARQDVSEARGRLQGEHAHALAALQKDVVGLALEIASKATGRKLEHEPAFAAMAAKEVAAALAAPEGGAKS
ncbi:MAG TPA: ATP synthase F0 subunit B [Planctomycetota bacterium]|nr:ATP synthase F0 subunit B [Planctomycetota bacterium]